MRFAQLSIGLALSVLVVLLCGTATLAHEIGTTQVSVLFQENRAYTVEIVTDAAALVEKLAASGGQSLVADNDPIRLLSQLKAFDAQFRRRVRIAFDDSVGSDFSRTSGPPATAYEVSRGKDAESGPVARIRLIGEIPSDARQFTWTYGWTFASYTMTVRNTAATQSLEGGQTSEPVALITGQGVTPLDRFGTARRYLTLGFTHILPYGLNQTLFVLGIYLLGRRARGILWQFSAFTLAQSMTFVLGMYGLVAASPRIVESLITLSIAYVAIENVFLSDQKPWRVALVFTFGLMHGLGLAAALRNLGLPSADLMTAVVTFNLGIAAAQLIVLGGAFVLIGRDVAAEPWYRRRIVVPASLVMACTAVYWAAERLAL